MISEEFLKRFKDRMIISHKSEDPRLNDLLSSSYAYVKSKCGDFNLEGNSEIDIRGQDLVLERARYAFHDAVEHFEDNFLSDITSLGIDNAYKSEGDADA